MAIKPTKVRINGQLVETTEEDLQGLAQEKGLPAPPVTPVGAAGVGANPDQAKMAGVGTQKQAAATVALKSTDTLAGAQRLDAPRTQATGQEAGQAAKATQMKSLEGMDTRVQALVGQHLASLQAKATDTARFNTAQMATLAPTADRPAVESLLTAYQQANAQLSDPNLSPEARKAAQDAAFQARADLQNQHGIANPDDYLDTSAATIGQAAAGALADPSSVTVGALDVSQLGMSPEDLTSIVGPGWESLSVPDFARKIEDLRQAEFQRINGLRAQLAGLAPGSAQRDSILRELGDQAQVGVTGVEQGVRQLAEKLDTADQVTFAGRTMPVSELLKDENVSDMVSDYLNESGDPEFKEKLKAEHPELAAWIESNRDSLKALSDEMGKTDEAFSGVQDAERDLATVGEDVSLNDEVMKTLIPGWGEDAVAGTTDLSGNNVYSVLKAETTSDADRSSIANKLNADPELAEALKDLPPDEILAAHQAAETMAADPVMQALMDGMENSGFMTDPAARKAIHNYGQILYQLRKSGDDKYVTMLEDPEFLDLMQSGELNRKNVKAFLKNPQAFQEYSDYKDLVTEFKGIEKGGNIDKALQFMFGDDKISEKGLTKLFTEAKKRVSQDPSDALAAGRYKSLLGILGPDGKLDKKEKKTLMATIKAGLGGGTKTFADAIADKKNKTLDFTLGAKIKKAVQPDQGLSKSTTVIDAMGPMLKDKKVTTKEMAALSPEQLKALWAMPADWQKKNKIPTKKQVTEHRNAVAVAKTITSAKTHVTTATNKHKFSATFGTPAYATMMADYDKNAWKGRIPGNIQSGTEHASAEYFYNFQWGKGGLGLNWSEEDFRSSEAAIGELRKGIVASPHLAPQLEVQIKAMTIEINIRKQLAAMAAKGLYPSQKDGKFIWAK